MILLTSEPEATELLIAILLVLMVLMILEVILFILFILLKFQIFWGGSGAGG